MIYYLRLKGYTKGRIFADYWEGPCFHSFERYINVDKLTKSPQEFDSIEEAVEWAEDEIEHFDVVGYDEAWEDWG